MATTDLKHRVCPCQLPAPDGGFARCGVKLGGGTVTHTSMITRPMDVCIICTDIRLADTVCEYCHFKPSAYYAN